MEILTKEMVRLGAQATDKTDAIKQSGELLVQAGCVAPAYVDGMLARERVMSNYLGSGVAIPHGELKDLALVYRTGVSVLQLPEGVEWEPGEKAHLVVGLAATSDELVDILSNLLEVLQEPGSIELLAHTTDPMVIVERLARSPGERQADAKHRAPF
jgi:mannitol/fructose-specific phosphotransferase system IIA component